MGAQSRRNDVPSESEGATPKSVQHTGRATTEGIFLFLLAFRLLNALSTKTFFQPDEYFQSLEPAWAWAFGSTSGAWITWEWEHQLRSAIHPAIFAATYYSASGLATLFALNAATRANILIAAPKIVQAACAATGDFYTWRLARRIHGPHDPVSWLVLALTICSPWQWFVSIRTFANAAETTLTAAALTHWPWSWASGKVGGADGISGLRRCLMLAALACVLRPTNILIWIPLSSFLLACADPRSTTVFIRETIYCGCLVLGLSAGVDRWFYGQWTLPSVRFLYFNLVQSLAIFYGSNDWHYYLTQGLPLLLTITLPFILPTFWPGRRIATRLSCSSGQTGVTQKARVQLIVTVVMVVSAMSLISHKEVRFIYPLLPALQLLVAENLAGFLWNTLSISTERRVSTVSPAKRVLLACLLSLSLAIALYTTLVHQSGVVSVVDFLRHQHELALVGSADHRASTTVGFLMPCHSTPWRSHLVHDKIHAWALGCEPPINLNVGERMRYVDEADRFYADPARFMRTELPALTRPDRLRPPLPAMEGQDDGSIVWPAYLVFFEQLEKTLSDALQQAHGASNPLALVDDYHECWRGFNSHWHDDWRRQGDVLVWCRRPDAPHTSFP